jgi:hypothetical protein
MVLVLFWSCCVVVGLQPPIRGYMTSIRPPRESGFNNRKKIFDFLRGDVPLEFREP